MHLSSIVDGFCEFTKKMALHFKASDSNLPMTQQLNRLYEYKFGLHISVDNECIFQGPVELPKALVFTC